MGQRHPGAHRYGLATVVPNCTRDATAVAESAHVEMALRNYYTGRELSLRTLDIRLQTVRQARSANSGCVE